MSWSETCLKSHQQVAILSELVPILSVGMTYPLVKHGAAVHLGQPKFQGVDGSKMTEATVACIPLRQ